MIPSKFEYVRPRSLDEAFAALAEHGDDAKILAGGHSLIPMMKLRLAEPGVLVDISRLPDLAGITFDELSPAGANAIDNFIASRERGRRERGMANH